MVAEGREQIVFHSSTGFKNALGEYAGAHKTSMSQVIQDAVSAYIGYDLSADPKRVRAQMYASPEEQTKANLERAALMRWGNKTATRMLIGGHIEEAGIIARAVEGKDYSILRLLKAAAEGDQTAINEVLGTDDEETE